VKCIAAIVSIACFLTASSAQAENWPQWRGPTFDGVSAETNLPGVWGPDKNVVWRLPLPGVGSSTPAVWGDRLFFTCLAGEDLVLMCVSTSGKELWRHKLGADPAKRKVGPGGEGNLASASVSTDGKHVWAFVGSGQLACLDFEGKEVWSIDLQKQYGKFNIQFGMHSTPVVYEDRMYLQLIHSGGAHVIALDKSTGKEVWNVVRKSDARAECMHSYASPCLWRNGNQAYLITHGNDYAIAHRLEDGSEIWRVTGLNPKDHYNPTLRFVASPVAVADLIVVPSAKNGPVVGLKPDARGEVAPGGQGQQWRIDHNTPDVPSPLVHNGLVYLCRENGSLLCLDAKTGEVHYNQRTHDQRHRASPVYADGKIYLTARDGNFCVVQAGLTFKLLAKNTLPDVFTASPAISNGRIYLRGWDSLWAIGSPVN
jgi:outer membrane protein assembly factor BamB